MNLHFAIKPRMNGSQPFDVPEHEQPNDLVVMVDQVEITRVPIQYKGIVESWMTAHRELVIEAVTPFIERMFAPIQATRTER